MRIVRLVAFLLLLFVAFAALSADAAAQDITLGEGDTIELQFDEVAGTPLLDFIKLCQDMTGRQLNYEPRDVEEARLRFVGRKVINRVDFWSYFQAVLKAYDYVIVSYGPLEQDDRAPGFYAIRKTQGGTTKPGYIKSQAPVVTTEQLENFKNDPNIVLTTSFPLKFVSAQEAMNMMQTYFSDPLLESVRAVSNSNSLVVTGYAQTLYGAKQLLQLIDTQPTEYEPRFAKIELKFAVAEEIKAIVDQLVAAERGTGAGGRPGAAQNLSGLPPQLQEPEPHIEADPRTNSLLVVAASGTLETILNYIRVLDIEVDPRGDTHVYRLKNSAAIELEEILNEWAENAGQAGTGATAGGQPGAAGGATTGGRTLEQPISVVADEASNSLIITASRSRYAQILEIVKKLDVRRRQVLIETALVEINGTLNDTLGVELGYVNAPNDDSDRRGFGVTSFGLSTLTDTDNDGFVDFRVPLGLQPDTAGSPGITAGIFKGDDFQVPVLVQALKSTTDANVLSMPSILVNDNEEAVISSLDQIPTFQTSQGEVSDQTTFDEFQDAGITLNISPSISAGNYLRLLVRLEVSTFTSPSGNPPPKATRELETEVTLPDGHTMVIGGIVSADERSQVRSTPWFGELPLLGWLFRASSEQANTVNLYVFITPHIISDDFSTLDELSYVKKRESEALNGKIHVVDPDWDQHGADTRLLDAAVSGVFDLPTYAPPLAEDEVETPARPPADDEAGYGELPPDSPEEQR